MTENPKPVDNWIRLQDLPLIPFMLLFGFHVTFLAMMLRTYLRVPYVLGLVVLYTLLTIPLWLWSVSYTYPLAATIAVALVAIIPPSVNGEAIDGENFEHSAPAHLALIMAYMVRPIVDA